VLRATMGTVLALPLVWLAVAAPLAAQRGRSRLGLGIGLTAPTGEYHADAVGDGFNIGWQGLLTLDLTSGRGPIGARLDLSYGENPGNSQLNADLAAEVGQPVDASIHMLSGSLDLTLGPPAGRGGRGYLLGGVGVCRTTLSARSGSVTADTTENKFAWNVGGGVAGGGKRLAPFAEIRYTHVEPAFDGPSLPFFSFTAGVRF